MSLLPYSHPLYRTGNWWDPSTLGRLFDQDFGVGLLDNDPFFTSQALTPVVPYWLRVRTRPAVANLERGLSEVRNDADKFSVNLDVSHFTPEEVKVKVVDNNLIIQGKHEEKTDPHGFVSRSFTRRYVLPKDIDQASLASHLSEHGILRIEAPKVALENPKERHIPVQLGVGGQQQRIKAVEGKNGPQAKK